MEDWGPLGGKGLEEMEEKSHSWYFTKVVYPLCQCQNLKDIKENVYKLWDETCNNTIIEPFKIIIGLI